MNLPADGPWGDLVFVWSELGIFYTHLLEETGILMGILVLSRSGIAEICGS